MSNELQSFEMNTTQSNNEIMVCVYKTQMMEFSAQQNSFFQKLLHNEQYNKIIM